MELGLIWDENIHILEQLPSIVFVGVSCVENDLAVGCMGILCSKDGDLGRDLAVHQQRVCRSDCVLPVLAQVGIVLIHGKIGPGLVTLNDATYVDSLLGQQVNKSRILFIASRVSENLNVVRARDHSCAGDGPGTDDATGLGYVKVASLLQNTVVREVAENYNLFAALSTRLGERVEVDNLNSGPVAAEALPDVPELVPVDDSAGIGVKGVELELGGVGEFFVNDHLYLFLSVVF